MNRFTIFKISFVLFFVLVLDPTGGLAQLSSSKPIKAFVLCGQSNMQGHAHVRTLQHLANDEATASMLGDYVDAKGEPLVHQRIDISLLSSNGVTSGKLTTGFGANNEKIGPELSFGVTMQKSLGDEPILIIKTAWGGKSLHTDFRPPSAGPFVFSPTQLERIEKQKKDIGEIKKQKTEATGHYYRMMLEHVKNVVAEPSTFSAVVTDDQKVELAGFVWFQGWNDMVDSGVYPQRGQPGGYDDYSKLLAHFIRDVRKDLNAPELPFVIGVMGVGGPTANYRKDQQRHVATHQGFRNAMAAPAKLPEFENNVRTVLTEEFWDLELGQLVNRRDQLRNQIRLKVKSGEIPKNQQRTEQEKLFKEQFSESEARLLEIGVSNAAYHYLGSGKIMMGIGKGFSDAMTELLRSNDPTMVN